MHTIYKFSSTATCISRVHSVCTALQRLYTHLRPWLSPLALVGLVPAFFGAAVMQGSAPPGTAVCHRLQRKWAWTQWRISLAAA